MKIKIVFCSILLPLLLTAQTDVDITGRISQRIQYLNYDEASEIKPDSVDDKEYSKSTLIPGMQETFNLSLFGRMHNFDFTLLSDIKHNDWNQVAIKDINSIERFSLNLAYLDHEVIVGDFFQSGMERFIQSREIRGFKYTSHFNSLWNTNSFLSISGLWGQTQRAFQVGDRLTGIYKQYDNVGQFQRNLGSGHLTIGQTGLFDCSFKYLQGQDLKSSIDESINTPLKNLLIGAEGNLYLWNKKLRLFGDYYSSKKDSIDAGSVNDYSMQSGIDFVYNDFKLLAFYQYIGFDYFTMGYPYLENDKEGIKAVTGYRFSKAVVFNADYEIYENNLNQDRNKPITKTNILNTGISALFQDYPEITLNFGLRYDNGDKILSQDSLELSTDKNTQKYEVRLAHNIKDTRLSLSLTSIDLDDKSLIGAGVYEDSTEVTPLGTDQFISTFNFYAQAGQYLYFSGGVVYSALTLTNDQKINNIYLYESNRWDIIPRRLKFESTLTAIFNEAENGGVQDYLSDYFQFNAEISFEYFFSDFVSFKIITGTDSRQFKYKTEEALEVIADADYGPTFFNGNESYSSWTVGAEFNWNF